MADYEMMYYADLLLELPRLVYLSEFKECWKQGNWNSTKKRSVRKIRKVFDDFNCRKSLITRFGLSDESEKKKTKKKGCGDVAGKKRKRTNPNPNPNTNPNPNLDSATRKTKKPKLTAKTTTTTTLLKLKFKLSGSSSSNGNAEKDGSSSSSVSAELVNVGRFGDGVLAGKKRKKNPSPDASRTTEFPTPAAKKHKSSLKVTFKFSGHGRDQKCNVADKDSSNSSGSNVSKELCDVTKKNKKPIIPDLNIPDLNIPITMIEDDLL